MSCIVQWRSSPRLFVGLYWRHPHQLARHECRVRFIELRFAARGAEISNAQTHRVDGLPRHRLDEADAWAQTTVCAHVSRGRRDGWIRVIFASVEVVDE